MAPNWKRMLQSASSVEERRRIWRVAVEGDRVAGTTDLQDAIRALKG